MPACSAPNCTNRPERPNGKTFHLFPKDGSLRQQWVREVNREYWTPSKRSLLCSDHFTESCFDKTGQTTRLKDNAVPTLFDIPAPTRKKARPREEPPESETMVPAQRGRPRKKQKQETSTKLSREELEAKLQLLEEHNKKLTKLLSRSPRPSTVTETKKTESKNKNIFVFRYPRRQILLKVAYLGWDYQSCASQEEIQQSIEDKLLQALLKTNLTESIISSKFERCSSNSEGFSPFDQVISIIVRSNLKSGLGVIPPDKKAGSAVEENPTLPLCAEENGEQEIDYTRVVNEALPMEIRLLAWCPVQAGYSPKSKSPIKTFKYFFPRGSLNIELMNEAAQHLIGRNDFRNFYSKETVKDLGSVSRNIISSTVLPTCCDLKALYSESCQCASNPKEKDSEPKENVVHRPARGDQRRGKRLENAPEVTLRRADDKDVGGQSNREEGYDMCVATLKGEDFLCEEVRKIMALLFSVGVGKAEPDSVVAMLDASKQPRKKQHLITSEVPLVLFKAVYEEEGWHWDSKALRQVISQLQAFWMQQAVRASAMRHILKDLENQYSIISRKDLIDPLPQDQCENLVGKDSSSVFQIVAKTTQNDEADFNHTATLLLIEFIRQRFQRFLLIHSRAVVYREVQEELCFRGFSFTIEKIRRKWNNLITTYRRIKEKNSEDPKVKIMWDYFQLLDDLLGTTVLTVPPECEVQSGNSSGSKGPVAPQSTLQTEEVPLTKPASPAKASAPSKLASTPTKAHSPEKMEAPKNSQVFRPNVPIKSEERAEPPVIHIVQSSAGTTLTVPPRSPSAPLHSEKTVVLQTSTPRVEKVQVNGKASDPSTVFLEYQIEQGERRLDVMDEYFEYMKERLTKKMEYKREKALRDSKSIKVLREIGDASENLKKGLLEVKAPEGIKATGEC
ncbi:uncharacterized protein LOC125039492 isoform X2 [Penaeus chinensis]|uniref:uncharacterized protein LOC125039492 isoform X2 n=1 Tax=Penaeus chinensis TaxID=139456 RepID=UPI001FB6D1BF|nr:uncharacterized protein LOC125039492 isoform X2 [Penaeus chinensis]